MKHNLTLSLLLVLTTVLLSGGCNKNDARNQECGRWSDWFNQQNAALFQSITPQEREGARTNADRASNCRKFAAGARKIAKTPHPFKDPWVKDLADRFVASFETQASAFDACATAWDKNDHQGVRKALKDELDAAEIRAALSTEWLEQCRQ